VIVVDTSALVTMFLRDPGFEPYLRCVAESSSALIPVSCYLEFALLRRLGTGRREWIDRLIAESSISLAALEPQHGPIAADAASIYGKGSGHPAQLNFGDCLTYAIAKYRDLPVLHAGRDFVLTDIRSALETG
jgi:ribonuclease VapC